MKYYIQKKNGDEMGPIDEDILINMAKKNDISASTPVRNTLVTAFKPAKKISCLKPIFKEKTEYELIKKKGLAKQLHRSEGGICSPPLNYRIGAFFLDSIMCILIIIASYNLFKIFGQPNLGEKQAMSLFLASIPATILSYYSFCLGIKAQTFGFWFFGIMVIKNHGEPAFFGRCFFLGLFFIITMPLVPIFIFIFNKGLHEALSGTRIVNVRMG